MPNEVSIDLITLGALACIFLCAFLCDRDFERRLRDVARRGVSGDGRGSGSWVPAVCAVRCLGALAVCAEPAEATTLSFTGNLRSDAT